MLSSSSSRSQDNAHSTSAVGSTLSGDAVIIRAKRDVGITGSNVVGTHDVALAAGNNVTITTAQNTSNRSFSSEEKTSGMFSSGASVTIGNKEQSDQDQYKTVSNNGSMVGSTNGNLAISAGTQYTQTGSQVVTLDGDIGIAAKTVDINAAYDAAAQTSKHHTQQSGLSLGVSAPIITAVQTVQKMGQAAGKTDDPRMKLMAAASAVSAAGNAASAAQNPTEGVTVSLTVGASSSDNENKQTSSTVLGSSVKAGGNVIIAATGAGQDSHLNLIGSNVSAAQNALLKADGDINLNAAHSSSAQHSTSSSRSAAVGIAATYGANGMAFGITANAAGSRGNADGNDVTQANSHVNAGKTLILESGHDTNLFGGVASADQVLAHVGTSGSGNLNIHSLQDSSTYYSKDQSIGASVTIGLGASGSISASQSKVNGDYANVGEQSGIRAGDGGFIVNVNGNTDLKGGVIAGTDTAAQGNRNLLITQTLTHSDIANHSNYDASSMNIGGGYSADGRSGDAAGKAPPAGHHIATFTQGGSGTSAGFSSTSGNTSGTSHSGVSAGALVIGDDQHQQQLTGQSAAHTIAAIQRDVGTETTGSLGKDWDGQQLKDKVAAEAQITAAFGQQAAREIGDYAGKKQAEALARGDKEEAGKWKEGGAYRVALHTATGALTGNLAGAAGALTSATAMTAIGKAIDGMDLPAEVKQGLGQVSALALGAVVGGGAGAASSLNVEANNRTLHQDERQWAKANAKRFAREFKEQTGQDISSAQAEKMLLGVGYRMTDAAAGIGPGVAGPRDDAVAASYISRNAGKLFKATAEEYNNPGKLGGPLTPEQAALPAAEGNPVLGLGAAAAVVTGGLAFVAGSELAAAGAGAAKFGADAWAAYKAATASYWMGTALGTGAAVGGGGYMAGAVAGAFSDARNGGSFAGGFDQRFSYPGLGAAMTVGGLTGMYGTAMFNWAGVPNALGNWLTIPGFVIRTNSGVFGKVAGAAAQGAVNQSNDR